MRRVEAEQVVFYGPGVGTFGLSEALFEWQKVPAKVLGLAFGWGLTRNVEEAYRFVMRHFAPGDRLYLFGFSRGAYTARALAGMINAVGLLYPEHENLVGYATRIFRNVPEGEKSRKEAYFELQKRFRKQFSRECPVHFLGLWDTVKSVGWIGSPLKLPFTTYNTTVACVRHALAIDERRCYFRQHLWHAGKQQDVKQVWFAGTHSDVGGGYPEAESGLSKVSLEWMAREARERGLLLDEAVLSALLAPGAGPSWQGPVHQSLHGAWWWAELLPRRFENAQRRFRAYWRWPLIQRKYVNRPRKITAENGAMVHHSVWERIKADACYKPPNVPRDLSVEI